MDAAAQLAARLPALPVLVVGRAGMDLYPVPDGATIEAAREMVCDVGGSAGNIAVAYARQGGRAWLMSAFSNDAVGRYVARALEGYGVDLRHCGRTEGLERTSLALAESVSAAPNVVIYRNDAADLAIDADAAGAVDMAGLGAVAITGTALSREPSRGACSRLVEMARKAGCPAVLDIDYRPQAWRGADEARRVLGDVAGRVDMVVGNDEEFALVAGGAGAVPGDDAGAGNGAGQGDDVAKRYARGLAGEGGLVLYKMGEGGCDVLQGGERTHVGIHKVDVLKPFGAGDAFLAGVFAGLGLGDDIAAAVSRGAAAAAIVVSRRGCASAMPDRGEVDAMIAGAA